MWMQIRILTKLQACNLLRLNEARYCRDPKKKRRFLAMGLAGSLAGIILLLYIVLLAASFQAMGLIELLPMYLFAITSLLLFFLSVLRTGSGLFQIKSYEMQISLPVTEAAIVASRFVTLYLGNLIAAVLLMLPGMALYGWFAGPSPSAYLYGAAGTLLLPLLPITAATAAGALITAASARLRHGSLVSAALTLALAVGIVVFGMGATTSMDGITADDLQNMALLLSGQIKRMYPPAIWFGESVAGSAAGLLLSAGVSIGAFLLMFTLVRMKYASICAALQASGSRGSYRMKALNVGTPLAALYKKELRHYFSSGVYVVNTAIGYVLMVVFAAGLLAAGEERIEELMGMPGLIRRTAPILLAMMAALNSTTACSISLEGKQWWISQTLPISPRLLFNSKILVNITVALPFYLISEILICLALRPALEEALLLWLAPAVYLLYAAVVGIAVNAKLPFFDWEHEGKAVKQGGSAILSMLLGLAGTIVPLMLLTGNPALPAMAVMAPALGAIAMLTLWIYRKNNRMGRLPA